MPVMPTQVGYYEREMREAMDQETWILPTKPIYCCDCGLLIMRKRNVMPNEQFMRMLCDPCGDIARQASRAEVQWRAR